MASNGVRIYAEGPRLDEWELQAEQGPRRELAARRIWLRAAGGEIRVLAEFAVEDLQWTGEALADLEITPVGVACASLAVARQQIGRGIGRIWARVLGRTQEPTVVSADPRSLSDEQLDIMRQAASGAQAIAKQRERELVHSIIEQQSE